jgi:hypothetical protein
MKTVTKKRQGETLERKLLSIVRRQRILALDLELLARSLEVELRASKKDLMEKSLDGDRKSD